MLRSLRARTIVLAAACLAACVVGCGDDASPPPPEPRPVRVVEAQPASSTSARVFSGRIQAPIRARLSFRVPGRVVRRPVEIGSLLARGDLVASLETADYRLRVDQAEARLAGARAAAREAETSYERTAALYATDSVSKGALDRALAAVESARSAVREAERGLEIARRELSYTRLEAPARGLIADAIVEVGENVQAGQTVAAFAEVGAPLEIEWTVPETLIGPLRPGRAVQIAVPALGGERLPATVTEVGATPRLGASTYPVVAVFDAIDLRLRPGMAGEVEMPLGAADVESDAPATGQRVVLLPSHAVAGDPLGRYVFVVEPLDLSAEAASTPSAATGEDLRTVRRREVSLGTLGPRGVEVLSGLEGGETVVAAGVTRLDDGQTVRLLRGDPLQELPSTALENGTGSDARGAGGGRDR